MSFHKARYICIRNLLLSKTLFCKLVSESAIRKPEYSTPELLVLSYSFLANFSAWSYFIEVCIFPLLLRFYEICTKDCWITAIQGWSWPSRHFHARTRSGPVSLLTEKPDDQWQSSPQLKRASQHLLFAPWASTWSSTSRCSTCLARSPVHNVYIGQFFSSRPRALRHILKSSYRHTIQHIFVPTRSVERNIEKIWFLWASNSKFVIFPQIFPCSNYKI